MALDKDRKAKISTLNFTWELAKNIHLSVLKNKTAAAAKKKTKKRSKQHE